jgi:hypothetical protein
VRLVLFWAAMTGLVFLAGLGLCGLILGCAPVKVGPFVQARHIPCSHEAGCPLGYRCGFAHVDAPLACLWVARGYDDVLDNMPNEPAQ